MQVEITADAFFALSQCIPTPINIETTHQTENLLIMKMQSGAQDADASPVLVIKHSLFNDGQVGSTYALETGFERITVE